MRNILTKRLWDTHTHIYCLYVIYKCMCVCFVVVFFFLKLLFIGLKAAYFSFMEVLWRMKLIFYTVWISELMHWTFHLIRRKRKSIESNQNWSNYTCLKKWCWIWSTLHTVSPWYRSSLTWAIVIWKYIQVNVYPCWRNIIYI